MFYYTKAKRLSESLEMAYNSIEAYEGIVNNANEENNTLTLTVQQLQQSNDSLLIQLREKAKEHNVKIDKVATSATQTQHLSVKGGKGVEGELTEIITKDSIYTDSIQFNDLTNVYYTITNDTVDIQLDISNQQFLYTFKHKEWKNKKNFFKRLITLDFKKVWKHEYKIINTNELIKTSDVRVVELIE